MDFTGKTKLVLKSFGSALFYYSGLRYLYYNSRSKGILFLAYHDISERDYLFIQVPPEIFTKQIDYLRSHYKIISLSEAVALLRSSKKLDKNYAVITFDDGYRSIYTTVYPVLKKYNIPFTVYLTTESIDTGIPPFVDCLALAIQKTKKDTLDLSHYGLNKYPLKTKKLKEIAIEEINSFSKGLSSNERKSLIKYILGQLDISIDSLRKENFMLSWDEVTEMSKDPLVEFGAHTLTHPSLSRIPLEDAKREIIGSKKKMEEMINKEVTTFAYPYGTVEDVNNQIIDLVSKSGFKSACLLTDVSNKRIYEFSLPRKCIVTPSRSKLFIPFAKSYFAFSVSNITRKSQKASLKDGAKIIYFIDNLFTIAGTERHLQYLVNNLDRSRFSVMVCAFKASEAMEKWFKERGIPFMNLDLDRIYTPSAFLKFFKLRSIIKKFNPDIVQTFHFKSDTYGVLAARLAGVKHIVSSRRDTGEVKKPRQVKLNKIVNKYINRFIMVCNGVGKSFQQLENIPPEKMVTIYNGVDAVRFSPYNGKGSINIRKKLNLSEEDFVVGTSAIFRPEKAYHVFFEGIEKVMSHIKNLKVLVCGEGQTKEYFVNYCINRPLGKIVKFMGYVQNIEDYLSAMDVFCLVPNKNEGFSNAILEAMAMARPVIATDVGGNAEAVVHGETGIIIPPDDPDSLAEAILDLYRNPEKRLQMGQKARERAVNVFSLERMIKEHEDFYLSLINERK